MQRFGHIFGFFLDQRCAWWLGGCGLGNYWSQEAMGPCQTHCKTFKIAKIKIPSPRPPFGELENLLLFPYQS
jgi:hypothetical protein